MATTTNAMQTIKLAKVTLNMGAGEDAPKLESSKKILAMITKKKIVVTKTHTRTSFGTARGKTIGCMITLRGKEAEEMLKRMVVAKEKKLLPRQFDNQGNFAFGIQEYIHIPGAAYDPDIGILGLDVCVTLERPGYRVKKRSLRPGRVGNRQRITKEEAIAWATRFGFQVGVKEES